MWNGNCNFEPLWQKTADLETNSPSVCGNIGFVGLIVPHMVRAFMGHAPGRILLPSALLGGSILLAADMVTRLGTLYGPLRLGVVTAIIGAPVFLFIVYRTRGTMR